ncbi:MAG: hypothetical protein QHJ73_17860, partial [Armatimonadota bacterium]|nr:hypothetical protein [Armatimonadota bacterium]
GRVLLVCGNLGVQERDVTLGLHPEAMGLRGALAATDPCDDKPVRWLPEGGRLELKIPACDYRMVLLTEKERG